MLAPPRCVVLATAIVLAVCSLGAAQGIPTISGEIRGRIVNAANKTPIGIATVDATDSGAAAVTAHVSTDADGSFRIPGLRPGRYRVRILALGYTPRNLPPVKISAASLSVDMGTVTLTAAAVGLQPRQGTRR